jgi:predicted ATPase with chaperone activity
MRSCALSKRKSPLTEFPAFFKIIYWTLQRTACTMYKEHNKNCTCNQFNNNKYMNLKVISREKRNMEIILVERNYKKNTMLDGEVDYNIICFGRLCL